MSKPRYTISREDGVTTKTCSCSCTNSVTVYYSSSAEADVDDKIRESKDVKIKVLEVVEDSAKE